MTSNIPYVEISLSPSKCCVRYSKEVNHELEIDGNNFNSEMYGNSFDPEKEMNISIQKMKHVIESNKYINKHRNKDVYIIIMKFIDEIDTILKYDKIISEKNFDRLKCILIELDIFIDLLE